MIIKTFFFVCIITALNAHYFLQSFDSKSTQQVNISHESIRDIDRDVASYLDLRKSIFDIFDYLERKKVESRHLLSAHIRDLADHNVTNMNSVENLDQFLLGIKNNKTLMSIPELRRTWITGRIQGLKSFVELKSLEFQGKVDAHFNAPFLPKEQVREVITNNLIPNWDKLGTIAFANIALFTMFGLLIASGRKQNKKQINKIQHRNRKNKVIDILSEEVKDLIISNNLNINFTNTANLKIFKGHHFHFLLNECLSLLAEIPTDSKQIIVNNNNLNRILISLPISHMETLIEYKDFLKEITADLEAISPVALKVERNLNIGIPKNSKSLSIEINNQSYVSKTTKHNSGMGHTTV